MEDANPPPSQPSELVVVVNINFRVSLPLGKTSRPFYRLSARSHNSDTASQPTIIIRGSPRPPHARNAGSDSGGDEMTAVATASDGVKNRNEQICKPTAAARTYERPMTNGPCRRCRVPKMFSSIGRRLFLGSSFSP